MNETTHLERALLLMGQSRYELAEEDLRLFLAGNPQHAYAHALLSHCLIERKAYDEAQSEAQQAIHSDPGDSCGHQALGRVLHERNYHREALAVAEEALRLAPDNSSCFALAAQIHISMKHWGEALEAAEKGLELDPEDVLCNNLRAVALVNLGRKQEAGATIDAALARNPEDDFSHANMGWTWLERGQPDKAMHHFREALRLDPNMEWARIGIVEAMKARHFVYRWVLNYFLWMKRLSTRTQMLLVVGSIFVPRILGAVCDVIPGGDLLFLPLYFGYLIFVVMTWIADPLFNLILRTNRFGRQALSEDQVKGSNLLAVSLTFAGALLAVGIYCDHFATVLSGIRMIILMLPLSTIYRCDAGRPRLIMAAVSLLVACGALAPLVPEEDQPNLLRMLDANFFLASIGSQLLANVIMATDRRK